MPSQSVLIALHNGFLPLLVISVAVGIVVATRRRARCMAQSTAAIVLSIAAQAAWEAGQGFPLDWWQHFIIDVCVFAVVTAPPRHRWQAGISCLVLAQIILDTVWGICHDRTEMVRVHYFGATVLEYFICLGLLLWAGGGRVLGNLATATADRVARSVPHLVRVPMDRNVPQ